MKTVGLALLIPRRRAPRGFRRDWGRRPSPLRVQRPLPAPKRADEDEQKQHQRRELEGLVGREKSLVPVYQENSPDEDGKLDEDVHLTTVEMWLREKNPHHPEETEGRWMELRWAVLLASA